MVNIDVSHMSYDMINLINTLLMITNNLFRLNKLIWMKYDSSKSIHISIKNDYFAV